MRPSHLSSNKRQMTNDQAKSEREKTPPQKQQKRPPCFRCAAFIDLSLGMGMDSDSQPPFYLYLTLLHLILLARLKKEKKKDTPEGSSWCCCCCCCGQIPKIPFSFSSLVFSGLVFLFLFLFLLLPLWVFLSPSGIFVVVEAVV